MKALKNPTLIDFDKLVNGWGWQLASYSLNYNHFSPAVGVSTDGKGYYIRTLRDQIHTSTGITRTSWEYFKTDETGLIIESPRGYAGTFNGRIRIDLDSLQKAVEEYKDKRVNHG